ncbi:ABC transporter permease [Seohaeicola zhoushanensis]|uniref:ABC transporter permease n=1 Tax=Seohaeicola zhoushanensis TaxID=1569283 RepID=A0A8J3GZH3_9RHOB|nr:ABC transporter permease [Seohaeicola zhoushanensis]GHF55675.1 ABC transporter permease [Seohaeicola zhoushanensis]
MGGPAATALRAPSVWRRDKGMTLGVALLGTMVICALFAPLLGTVDPTAINPVNRLKPPSAEHWFGTDMVGRDLYSRVIYGARVSLIVGLSVAALCALAGLAIGLVSGSIRQLDGVIMRLIDAMMSIPPVLLAIALTALWRGSLVSVIVAVTLAETPSIARVVRGTVLSLRELPYVEASTAVGASMMRIILVHILPNTLPALLVQASYVCASAMIVESILSFLGAGIPPSIPSWGNIMADGRSLWLVLPQIIFFPAAFLSITVLAVNLVGDGLRDMLDPRQMK